MKIESKRNLPNDQELEEIFGILLDVFLREFGKLEGKEVVISCD